MTQTLRMPFRPVSGHTQREIETPAEDAVAERSPRSPAPITTPSSADYPSSTPHPRPPSSTDISAPSSTGAAASQHHSADPTVPRPSSDAPRHGARASTTDSGTRQVLGRRRRVDADDGSAQLPEGASSSPATHHPTDSRASKRTRTGSMSADGDGEASSNGTTRAVTTEPRAPQRSFAAPSTNGTHKAASSSVNGSSVQNGKAAARGPPLDYIGHDREEVTRLMIQALSEMGYQSAAENLSRESGYELESPTVAAFRSAVLNGKWTEAEQLLFGAATAGDGASRAGNGLVLAEGVDRDDMRFRIRQQKFLELLEQGDYRPALTVLRNELTPLNRNGAESLSPLIMCRTPDDVKAKAAWDGAQGESRHTLLSQLSRCISPSVMLPEHRLAVLLQQFKDQQAESCIWHTSSSSPSLYSDHTCDRSRFPTEAITEFREPSMEADGEVWQGGVGNLAWSPDDTMLVTCGRDGYARIWDMNTGKEIRHLEHFSEPISSCVWALDGRSFVLGAFDRERSLCTWNIKGEKLHTWSKKNRTEDLALSPDGRWLVAMDDEDHVHVYDFVTRSLKYDMELPSRPTSVSITKDSKYLLVNKQDGEARVFDIASRTFVQKYKGHSGGEFLIRSDFGGANENFVISGSEDGSVFIWHKNSGHSVAKLEAHRPRCNAVAWSPTDPCLLASCGDDGLVKIPNFGTRGVYLVDEWFRSIWTDDSWAKLRRDIFSRYLWQEAYQRPDSAGQDSP
ncbi:WD domain-containing protein [Diaporthe amygdali]|uniref:WD domain-containing protein n=1 Tax=Phomopsis amygdali TaxID=1214568 RepID=UPI0022FEC796|nr:WD domain-containing protein [Diaporthe amygdali]KAJ0114956.1 WD domain-containing protein [Diaporthe amygdali]